MHLWDDVVDVLYLLESICACSWHGIPTILDHLSTATTYNYIISDRCIVQAKCLHISWWSAVSECMFGGYQPESCVMMPIANGCDCQAQYVHLHGQVSVLIDGVIPSIYNSKNGSVNCLQWLRNAPSLQMYMLGLSFCHTACILRESFQEFLSHCMYSQGDRDYDISLSCTRNRYHWCKDLLLISFSNPRILVQHQHFLSHTVLYPVLTVSPS